MMEFISTSLGESSWERIWAVLPTRRQMHHISGKVDGMLLPLSFPMNISASQCLAALWLHFLFCPQGTVPMGDVLVGQFLNKSSVCFMDVLDCLFQLYLTVFGQQQWLWLSIFQLLCFFARSLQAQKHFHVKIASPKFKVIDGYCVGIYVEKRSFGSLLAAWRAFWCWMIFPLALPAPSWVIVHSLDCSLQLLLIPAAGHTRGGSPREYRGHRIGHHVQELLLRCLWKRREVVLFC